MKPNDATRIFAALSHPARLAVYRRLVEAGPDGMAASDIGDALGIARPTLSFHLKALAQAGLLHARRDGRFVFYAANFDTMNALTDFLTENCCNGESCAAVPAAPHTERHA